jgi:hypothetical protein
VCAGRNRAKGGEGELYAVNQALAGLRYGFDMLLLCLNMPVVFKIAVLATITLVINGLKYWIIVDGCKESLLSALFLRPKPSAPRSFPNPVWY